MLTTSPSLSSRDSRTVNKILSSIKLSSTSDDGEESDTSQGPFDNWSLPPTAAATSPPSFRQQQEQHFSSSWTAYHPDPFPFPTHSPSPSSSTSAANMSGNAIEPTLVSFVGSADGNDPRHWLGEFLRVALFRNWSDAQKVATFERYVEEGSQADLWWSALPSANKANWVALKAAFDVRWPKRVLGQQELYDRVENEIITEPELGQVTMVGGRMVGRHVLWAERVKDLAIEAGDDRMALWMVVRRNLPEALRHFLDSGTETFNTWDGFYDRVAQISTSALARKSFQPMGVWPYAYGGAYPAIAGHGRCLGSPASQLVMMRTGMGMGSLMHGPMGASAMAMGGLGAWMAMAGGGTMGLGALGGMGNMHMHHMGPGMGVMW